MIDGVRILLVEDHTVVRSSLALLLQSHGGQIVGEASNGRDAIARALILRPDVVLMDITLPDMDGIEATRQICEAIPETRVLALTMHNEDVYLVPFLEAGGAGYIRKSAADRDLITAIKAVRTGEAFIGAGGLEALLRQHRPSPGAGASPGPEVLSDRERLVLEKTARGFTSREIGEQLTISPHTVDTYRTRVMVKLNLATRHDLVEYALRHHIIG
ncbi:MAG: response regulator transcription factor [Chloroflexi bacterium]|nr:response regulator transcription factor [Chloroflexota bacterium]